MTWLIILAIAVLLAAAYLDVNSTRQFLKLGTAHEAGLFGFMAWLQQAFPASWPYLKAGATLILAGAAVWFLPVTYAFAAIMGMALYTLFAALANYQLSK